VAALVLLSNNRRLRMACVMAIAFAAVGLAIIAGSTSLGDALSDRLEERGPVDFRKASYAGGWEMFLEKPLTGWGFHRMPAELPRFVSGYDEKVLYPHNTYLELLVEHGLLGFALYLWLMWELWKLRRVPAHGCRGFLDSYFHKLWPIVMAVYWVNAAVVVMSYQFVNGLLFTMAGMLAAQRRRFELRQPC